LSRAACLSKAAGAIRGAATRFDHQMADVENAATAIMLSLRTLRRAGNEDIGDWDNIFFPTND